MHPKYHAIWGFVLSLILINYFNVTDVNALIFWLSSWLIIDLDHALRYVWIKRDLSPFNFWKYSYLEHNKKMSKIKNGEKNIKNQIYVFHGIESLLIIFILSYIFPWMIYVFMGFLFHLIIDWIDLAKCKINIFSKMSVIYVILTNKNKKSIMN